PRPESSAYDARLASEFPGGSCAAPKSDESSDSDGRMPRLHKRSPRLRLGRFFEIGVGVTRPLSLRLGIGLDQASGRTLHGDTQLMEQFAHVAWMILHVKL